jgi:uncharacterized protein (TIGR02058 family)
MSRAIAVQIGLGVDQHGQDAVKAARRACCAAIAYNALPCVDEGQNNLKIHVTIGVPDCSAKASRQDIASCVAHVKKHLGDGSALRDIFPVGTVLPVDVVPGGLAVSSGAKVDAMGDVSDEMVACVAAVTVGY